MTTVKKILGATFLTLLHLGATNLALWGQGTSLFFWPSLLLRLVTLILAAPALGVCGLIDLRFGLAIPFGALVFGFYLTLIYLIPKLHKLWTVIRSPMVTTRRALFVGTGVVALSTVAATREAKDLQLNVQDIELPKLPSELMDLKIVMLADLHRGPAVSQYYLEYVIDEVNKLQPDIIMMPGDFVSKSASYYPDLGKALSRLSPKIASFATLGNHDHWEGADECLKMLESAGIITLQNKAIYLDTDRQLKASAKSGLCIAGVDDLWTGKPDLDKALQGVPPHFPVILLSHNPDLAESKSRADQNVTVQLSGHTHGGQVIIPGLGPVATASSYGIKYLSGWAQGPHWPVFITKGVGTSTVPIRIGALPEIVSFNIKKPS